MQNLNYKRYKEFEKAWVDKIPVHWEYKQLKFLTTVNDQTLPETTNPDFELFYVDIGSIDINKGVTNKVQYIFEEAPSRARRIVKEGDVIVSTVRTYLKAIARISLPEDNLIVSTGFAVVRPTKIDSGFLAFLLRSSYFVEKIMSKSVGVSYPAINSSDLLNIKVCIPPPNEQQSIANFLDRETARIDTLIEKKLKFIETLKEKRIALISRAVTKGLNPEVPMKDSGIEWLGNVPEHWEVKRLKYQVQKVGSGVTPSGGATIYEDEGIPLIRSQNIYSNRFKLDDIAFITESIHNSMANSKVKNGDVLLNITGASLGRSFYMVDTFEEANVNQHVCIIRPNQSKVNTRFLHLLIISDAGQAQIWYDQTGSGREGLNFVSIKNFFFAFPPTLQEQNQIVETISKEVEKIDLVVIKTDAAIEKLKEYKTALISAAVTGKIKVG